MKPFTVIKFINHRLSTIAAILAVVGVTLMVFGETSATTGVIDPGTALTAVSQSQPVIQTKEVNQSFTLSGGTNQIITVSPNGIISVSPGPQSQVSTQTTPTPVASDPAPAQVPTSDTTTTPSTNTQTQPNDLNPTDPKAPVCPACGNIQPTSIDNGRHIECPMICYQ